MSSSRRKFLKAGMLAAIFAAVPLKNVLGHSWKDKDGNPPDQSPSTVPYDPLANYTKATFVSYLNSVFQLRTVTGVVAVTLLKVDDMAAPKDGECFSLLFRGGSRVLPQNTYTVDHASLGTFQLFLVPVGTDNNGAQGYLATINRLSYNDSQAPTALGSGTTKRSGSLTTTQTPTATPTPTPTNTSPSTDTPAPAAAPAITKPEDGTKPVRKKKPSWKSNDSDNGLIDQ